MLCTIYSGLSVGVSAITITVEVDVTPGISFHLVGLPDSAVRESQQRIGTALQTVGCRIPGRKIVINLAPADIKKEGTSLDLAIAVGIISASEQFHFVETSKYMILGELALDGSVRAIRGALPIAEHAAKDGFEACILPYDSAREAVEIDNIKIYGVKRIDEVLSILLGDAVVSPIERSSHAEHQFSGVTDFCDIKGQEMAKRAMEIAAAGGHNILISGEPGSGKSLLAKSLPSILPLMSRQEAIETSKIYSVSAISRLGGLIWERPFRSPHHTLSAVALTGGGIIPMPGEISLAHNGVLYLDEIAEFPKTMLELLRQPMEDRIVTISRMRQKIIFPCNFMLVASMNPCPCGYYGSSGDRCTCTPHAVMHYKSKLSGPLLDRIDIKIEMNNNDNIQLLGENLCENSRQVRERVTKCREIQADRFNNAGKHHINTNSQMDIKQIRRYCATSADAGRLLSFAGEKLKLSARGYTRVLKVARTIADLANSQLIETSHISEALHYREGV